MDHVVRAGRRAGLRCHKLLFLFDHALEWRADLDGDYSATGGTRAGH